MLPDDNWLADRRDVIFVLMLAAVVFTVHLFLTLRLHSLGTFDQWNVIFDSDLNQDSSILAHGWSLGNRSGPVCLNNNIQFVSGCAATGYAAS